LCRDSNPGWLSKPLLWRVRLTSCTMRVLVMVAAADYQNSITKDRIEG